MDDAGFEHDVVHTNHSGAIIALETKVGTGSSTAVADSVLAGTGSGTSGWSTAPSLAGLTVDTDTLHVDATNDRVGISTASPEKPLHVYHATIDSPLRVESGDLRGAIEFKDSTQTTTVAAGALGDDFTVYAGGADRLAVTSGGNVGIGTTSPSYKLDVNGDVGIDNGQLVLGSWDSGNTDIDGILPGTAFGALVQGQSSGHLTLAIRENDTADSVSVISGGGNYSTDSTFDTVVLYARADGKVGIGTTSPLDLLQVGDSGTAGSFRVHASGGGESFRVSGSVVRSTNIRDLTTGSAANVYVATSNASMYRSTSSIKYKTNVETMEDSYADAILGLRPVWYRSLCPDDPESYGYWGFIAEEVAEVDPRLVSFGVPTDYERQYDEDGEPIDPAVADLTEPEGVQYDRLVPHLVNLLKRHEARIAALEAA